MKRFIFALTLLIMLSLSIVSYSQYFYSEMQENVLRLHILAKSNSEYDQKIKLDVRDEILKATEGIDIKNPEKFISVAESVSNQYLTDNNIPYRAKAEYGLFHFPKKAYSSLTLPAGMYNGIRIILDDGKGENWWCVMYPPVCTTTDDNAIELLKNSLSDNSYEVITEKPQFRFWLLDFLNK